MRSLSRPPRQTSEINGVLRELEVSFSNKLGVSKAGEIIDQEDFLNGARRNFMDFYQPLVPWVNSFKREVFPGGALESGRLHAI
jgi:hypothetical protein